MRVSESAQNFFGEGIDGIESWYARQYFKKLDMEHENRNVEWFKEAIEKGLYPEKCLECFKAGLRFCGFWEHGFNCESVEKAEMIKKLERLGV